MKSERETRKYRGRTVIATHKSGTPAEIRFLQIHSRSVLTVTLPAVSVITPSKLRRAGYCEN